MQIHIMLVLPVEYINKFYEIHMSLVLDIFTRRGKSYRHVDETKINQMCGASSKPEQRLEFVQNTQNMKFLK